MPADKVKHNSDKNTYMVSTTKLESDGYYYTFHH